MPEAVRRTLERCESIGNVTALTADIRQGFPVEQVDLAVFSDVLYYLSEKEISLVLNEAEEHVVPGGLLLFVNEWQPVHRGLTSPEAVIRLMNRRAAWRQICLDSVQFVWTSPVTITIALFERL